MNSISNYLMFFVKLKYVGVIEDSETLLTRSENYGRNMAASFMLIMKIQLL